MRERPDGPVAASSYDNWCGAPRFDFYDDRAMTTGDTTWPGRALMAPWSGDGGRSTPG